MRSLAPPPVAPTRRMPPFLGAATLGRGSKAAAVAATPPANAPPSTCRLVTRWPAAPADVFLVLILALPGEPARSRGILVPPPAILRRKSQRFRRKADGLRPIGATPVPSGTGAAGAHYRWMNL